jgi:hypothetical protein
MNAGHNKKSAGHLVIKRDKPAPELYSRIGQKLEQLTEGAARPFIICEPKVCMDPVVCTDPVVGLYQEVEGCGGQQTEIYFFEASVAARKVHTTVLQGSGC